MPDGRLMPGCSYNNLYRHKDQRFFPNAEPVYPAPVPITAEKPATTHVDGKVFLPVVGQG
jgi:uncharacterized radical SAM superfamily Fe-S cluster-containing enzyme